MKNRNRINELSVRDGMRNGKVEPPPENIGQVYSMLNRQEQAIANLLKKYGDNSTIEHGNRAESSGLYDEYIKPRSQTIDVNSSSEIKLKLLLGKGQKPSTRQSSPSSRLDDLRISDQYPNISREKKINSSRNESISLPIIYQKSKGSKSKRKSKNKNQIMYQFKRDKSRMQNRLYKIYGEKNTYFENDPVISRVKPKRKEKNANVSRDQNSSIDPTSQDKLERQQLKSSQQQKRPQKEQIESDDETEGEQVPTMYYERQFRDLMRAQCLEELNFLYFSKNEKMKDWTDTLLSMIEKHDKEITSVRRKSKYMATFDDKFFSIGIFNTDDV